MTTDEKKEAECRTAICEKYKDDLAFQLGGIKGDSPKHAKHLWNALPREPEWQPMETAPKDKKILALRVRGDEGDSIFIAEWHNIEECWCDGGLLFFAASTMKGWMPLPAAPKEDK